jgi:outer membrane immunogenic protein
VLKNILLATSVTVLLSGTAMAADNVFWTGGHIGINAGYASGKFKTNFNTATIPAAPFKLVGLREDNVSSFVGGVQAGYNWQLNHRWVVGIEADLQSAALKNTFSGGNAADPIYGTYEINTKIQSLGTVRARVGYAVTERFLIYGTGGLAYGNVKTSYQTSESSGSSASFSTSKIATGLTFGAGAEYAMSKNWTIKAEYQ